MTGGEIKANKVKLSSCPWLAYEYPLLPAVRREMWLSTLARPGKGPSSQARGDDNLAAERHRRRPAVARKHAAAPPPYSPPRQRSTQKLCLTASSVKVRGWRVRGLESSPSPQGVTRPPASRLRGENRL